MTYLETHFDVNAIVMIEIAGRRRSSYRWLPAKQKTWFFGLVKRNSWYSEGFYHGGHYEYCCESGCWDALPSSEEWLMQVNCQVDPDKTVWEKPFLKITLKHDKSITESFETLEEAQEYVEEIKKESDIKFHVIFRK